jgi:short-subunit dehydrogenase
MTVIKGASAAVTGAASGIGRALALELAARGCDLALADRDEAGLKAVAAEISQAHVRKVSVHRVDVSKPEQVDEFAAAAIAAHPTLNIVINNAGVAIIGQFRDIDQAQMDWLFDINFWGVVHSTRAFLPHLERQREAHIANLSSIFGLVAPPGQSAYSASKFAVRGFSESLRHELQTANSSVRLTVVHPGGVSSTSIARNAQTASGITDNTVRSVSIDRFEAMTRSSPEKAARIIVDGIESNRLRILIGNDARFVDIIQRLRPGSYWAFLAKQVERRLTRKGLGLGY